VAASTSGFDFFNQISFQTPSLAHGSHRLDVQYGGNNSTAPLILDRLVVQNLTFIPLPSHHARLGAGAIAGIVIGSLAGFALIIIFGWFGYGKWKKEKLAGAPQAMGNEQGAVSHNQDGTD